MLGSDKGHPSSLNSPNLYRGSRLQVVHVMDSTPGWGQSISRKRKPQSKSPVTLSQVQFGGSGSSVYRITKEKKQNNVLEQTSTPVNHPRTPHSFRSLNSNPAESLASTATELSSL